MSRRLAGSNDDECKQKEENEWVDVLGNEDLMTKILRPGGGKRPEAGELVKISFKELTESDSDEQTTTQFVLGYGFNIDGKWTSILRLFNTQFVAFDLAIPLMYVGEQTHIKTHSRFTDDPNGDNFLEYKLELLDVQPADIVHLSVRISEAREAGNDYYNRGRYEKALRLYDYGIRLLTDAEDSVEDIDLRRFTFISNSAACLIKVRRILGIEFKL